MNNISEAVGYGIKALRKTPDEFFKLMEIANKDKKNDSYEYWLSRKVVGYCEENGLSFNEIFTKKVRILHDLVKDGGTTYKENFTQFIRDYAQPDMELISTVDAINLDKNIEFKNDGGIDIDENNLFFLNEVNPELARILQNNESAIVVFDARKGKVDKNNNLVLNAKNFNIRLKNEFEILLYRLITVVSAVDCSNVTFAFVSGAEDFADSERYPLLDLFTQYLRCEKSFMFNPLEVSDSVVNNGDVMLSFWKTDYSESGVKADMGTKESSCVAKKLSFDGNEFKEVKDFYFTYPDKEYKVPEEINSFKDLIKASVYNVSNKLIRKNGDFFGVLKEPVNCKDSFRALEVYCLLLNACSEEKVLNYWKDISQFMKDNYSVLSVEALSLFEFCNGALGKAKEMGIEEDSIISVLNAFNNEDILKEFYLRKSKLENNLELEGYLDCFLV